MEADNRSRPSMPRAEVAETLAAAAVHRLLGDDPVARAADRALSRVRARFDGRRWSEMFECSSATPASRSVRCTRATSSRPSS